MIFASYQTSLRWTIKKEEMGDTCGRYVEVGKPPENKNGFEYVHLDGIRRKIHLKVFVGFELRR